ncbi:MAG: DoxX family protein [Pseudomonadota bacterium]
MYDSVGKLILRLILGFSVLLHGIAKLFGGVSGIAGMLSSSGLPTFLAYGAYVGEVVGPVLLIVGWYSRLGAVLIALNMLFAIGLAHAGEILALGPQGGWAIELQAMFLFTAVALALTGPGRYSINRK